MEAEEADRMSVEVEVAVDARTLEALEVLEATVGGRNVEVIEADVLWRLMDAVEADRIIVDMEVAEVIVDARMVEYEGGRVDFIDVELLR